MTSHICSLRVAQLAAAFICVAAPIRAQGHPDDPYVARASLNQCSRADALIPLYSQEGVERRDRGAGSLQRGDLFTVGRAHTYVSPGRVRVLRFYVAVMSAQWRGEPARFAANDTVYVLNYIGEGYYNVWHRGDVYPVEEFWDARRSPRSTAIILRAPRELYTWAEVRSLQQRIEGWIRLDHARRSEAEGCDRTPLSQSEMDRLFNRVMIAHETNDTTSVRFLGPTMLQAYAVAGPPTVDSRFHIGLVQLVLGNTAAAFAQADSIGQQSSTHLFASILRAKAALARGDSAAARQAYIAFLANLVSERSRGLPEYTEHQGLITQTRVAATAALAPMTRKP